MLISRGGLTILVLALGGSLLSRPGETGLVPSYGRPEADTAWTPRSCISDTLDVRRDSVRTVTTDTVAPGITYRCIRDGRGPWVIHVISLDLTERAWRVDAERATGAFLGRETVSSLVARRARDGDTALVAINADFFSLRTGEVTSNHMVRGEWVKAAVVSRLPDTDVDDARTQFAVDTRGRPLMGRFELRGAVVIDDTSQAMIGLNFRPPDRPGLVLYTSWFGDTTPVDDALPATSTDSIRPRAAGKGSAAGESRESVEIVLRRVGKRGDSTLYRVDGSVAPRSGGTPIPRVGAVLSGTGETRAFVEQLVLSKPLIRVVANLAPFTGVPHMVVGGWPRLLGGGISLAAQSDSLEGTTPSFARERHPRSAIGMTRDSLTVLLLVVDGRRPWSVGMTLDELAGELRGLGAHDAMNLDGGGSSILWARGRVLNRPSDATGERSVGNALVVSKVPRRR
jgi:hypothetical protein